MTPKYCTACNHEVDWADRCRNVRCERYGFKQEPWTEAQRAQDAALRKAMAQTGPAWNDMGGYYRGGPCPATYHDILDVLLPWGW